MALRCRLASARELLAGPTRGQIRERQHLSLCVGLALRLRSTSGCRHDEFSMQYVYEHLAAWLSLTPQDVVYEIGSHDGKVLISCCKQAGCRGVGIEIDRAAAWRARDAAVQEGVRDKVTFRCQDATDVDLSNATVLFMYLLPRGLELLRPRLEALRPGTRVVSYIFKVPFWHSDTARSPPQAAQREMSGAAPACPHSLSDATAVQNGSVGARSATLGADDAATGAIAEAQGPCEGHLAQVLEAPKPGGRKRRGAEHSVLYVYQVSARSSPSCAVDAQPDLHAAAACAAPGAAEARTRPADDEVLTSMPSAAAGLEVAKGRHMSRQAGALHPQSQELLHRDRPGSTVVNLAGVQNGSLAGSKASKLCVASTAALERLTREACGGGKGSAGGDSAQARSVLLGRGAAVVLVGAFVALQLWGHKHRAALGTAQIGTRLPGVTLR